MNLLRVNIVAAVEKLTFKFFVVLDLSDMYFQTLEMLNKIICLHD